MAKQSTKNMGRPLKFKTVKELQEKIDAYFADCDPHPEEITEWVYEKKEETYFDKKDKEQKTRMVSDYSKPPRPETRWTVTVGRPYTITGLANFLGTSRETLINYQLRKNFFDTIKAAKDKVEEYWENQLLGAHATGPIFNLKNNYGWKDKIETDVTSAGKEVQAPAIISVIEKRDGSSPEAETASSN